MDYAQHIVRDPKVCGGEPVIKGTRVTLRTVLASLAEDATTAEILVDFPTRSTGSRNPGPGVRPELDENLPARLADVLTELGHFGHGDLPGPRRTGRS